MFYKPVLSAVAIVMRHAKVKRIIKGLEEKFNRKISTR